MRSKADMNRLNLPHGDEQTEFERDALMYAQPMQVVANQWRHVVILAATKDDTSGTVQDALHFVCLLLSADSVTSFHPVYNVSV